jgi:transposase
MNATTVAIDLGKDAFQLAVADAQFRVVATHRLSRAKFLAWWQNRPVCAVVMEACGAAHHVARWLRAMGHAVTLLPPQYVRAYVRRDKTDLADACALLEAMRAHDLRPVPIKTEAQQVVLALHRARQQWQATRTARINALRGLLREFGIAVPLGAARGKAAIRAALELADSGLPDALRPLVNDLLTEIRMMEEQVVATDRQLLALTRDDPVVLQLSSLPGIGCLSATAFRASVGEIVRFPTGRRFASWIGLPAREHSSGNRRHLAGMSKRGDRYLRTLLIAGARAVLAAAQRAAKAGKPLDRLRSWAVEVAQRRGYNKATVALANKLARILWATWRHQRQFDGNFAATA